MGNKRSKQWVGGGQVIESQTDGSTSTSDIIKLVEPIPRATIQGADSKVLVEAIYLHFSTHRLLATTLDALGFMVYTQQVSESTELPLQALDALSTDRRLYSNNQILMMQPLKVPPILAASDLLSVLVNRETSVEHHDYQATRKLDRAAQVLCLTVNSDVSDVVRCFVQWRVLLSYN